MIYFAFPDFVPLLDAIDYMNTTRAGELFAAIDTGLAATARYVDAASIPAPVWSPTRPAPVAVSPGAGGGGHSDAWWHGVAICEQGGNNSPYYGYFSYMDGSAAGLTWDQQVAKGNRTIAQYGDSAWAAACVAAGYRASPSG